MKEAPRAVSCVLLVLSILTPRAAFFVATRALPVHRGTHNLVYCARNPVATVVRTVQMAAPSMLAWLVSADLSRLLSLVRVFCLLRSLISFAIACAFTPYLSFCLDLCHLLMGVFTKVHTISLCVLLAVYLHICHLTYIRTLSHTRTFSCSLSLSLAPTLPPSYPSCVFHHAISVPHIHLRSLTVMLKIRHFRTCVHSCDSVRFRVCIRSLFVSFFLSSLSCWRWRSRKRSLSHPVSLRLPLSLYARACACGCAHVALASRVKLIDNDCMYNA